MSDPSGTPADQATDVDKLFARDPASRNARVDEARADLATLLTRAREAAGYTQSSWAAHLSETLGRTITQSAVSKWEAGKNVPRDEILYRYDIDLDCHPVRARVSVARQRHAPVDTVTDSRLADLRARGMTDSQARDHARGDAGVDELKADRAGLLASLHESQAQRATYRAVAGLDPEGLANLHRMDDERFAAYQYEFTGDAPFGVTAWSPAEHQKDGWESRFDIAEMDGVDINGQPL